MKALWTLLLVALAILVWRVAPLVPAALGSPAETDPVEDGGRTKEADRSNGDQPQTKLRRFQLSGSVSDIQAAVKMLEAFYAVGIEDGRVKIELRDGGEEEASGIVIRAPEPVLNQVAALLDAAFPAPKTHKDTADTRVLKVFRFKFLTAGQVAATVERLFPELHRNKSLRVIVDQRANTLVAGGTKDALDRVESVMAMMDVEPAKGHTPLEGQTDSRPPLAHPTIETKVLQLQHTRAHNVKAQLTELYPGAAASIVADANEKELWLRGPAELLRELEAVVLRMDEATGESAAAPAAGNRAHGPSGKSPSSVASGEGNAQVRIIRLAHVPAQEIAASLSTLFGGESLTIVAEPLNNTLLLRGAPSQIEAVQAAVMALDRPATERSPVGQRVAAPRGGGDHGDAVGSSAAGEAGRTDDDRLAASYRERNGRATALAREIGELGSEESDEVLLLRDTLGRQLRDAVSGAFHARQKWQAAEVAALRARLEQLERRIQLREQLKDRIIQRRIDELLHPERHWEGDSPEPQGQASRKRAAAPAADSTRADDFASTPEARDPASPDRDSAGLLKSLLDAEASVAAAKAALAEREFAEAASRSKLKVIRDANSKAEDTIPLAEVKAAEFDLDLALARVASANSELQVAEKRAGLLREEARTRIKLLEIDVASARLTLKNAEAEYERARKLRQSNVIPEGELDGKQLAYEQARLDLDRATTVLDSWTKALPATLGDGSSPAAPGSEGGPAPPTDDADSKSNAAGGDPLSPTPDGAASLDADARLAWEALGVKCEPADAALTLPGKYRGGLVLLEVRADSPAAATKLKAGDVLVGLGHWETKSMNDLTWILRRSEAAKTDAASGQSLKVYIVRDSNLGRVALHTTLRMAPSKPAN